MHAQKQFATAACLNHYVNCTHTPATLAVMSLLGVSCRAWDTYNYGDCFGMHSLSRDWGTSPQDLNLAL